MISVRPTYKEVDSPLMERIEELYGRYKQNSLSDDETAEFFSLIKSADQQTLDKLASTFLSEPAPENLKYLQPDADRILQAVKAKIASDPIRKDRPLFTTFYKALIGAAAVLAGVFMVYEFSVRGRMDSNVPSTTSIRDLPPGTKRATLTLDDGRVIRLENSFSGELANLDGTRVSKTANNELVYEENTSSVGDAKTNTLNIPRGGEYQLLLPDGTRVWLNAATTIKYPTRFDGRTRKVQLVGEAYFQVAKDPEHPFIVESEGQSVEVLGTHFNVNTYKPSAGVITLEEGKVRVSSGAEKAILRPGQQAAVSRGTLKVFDADMESALAWKNGLLLFRDAPLRTVLDEVSRWYDVEIEYRGDQKNRILSGGVSRTANLSAMLKILRLTGVKAHLEADGNRRKLVVE